MKDSAMKTLSRNLFSKSTIGTIIAAIEANNDIHCLQKRLEKFPLKLDLDEILTLGQK